MQDPTQPHLLAAFASPPSRGDQPSGRASSEGETLVVNLEEARKPAMPFPSPLEGLTPQAPARLDRPAPAARPTPAAPLGEAARPAPRRPPSELVWYDAEFARQVVDDPDFRGHLSSVEPSALDRSMRKRLKAYAENERMKQAQVRRDVTSIVATAPPCSEDLHQRLIQSRDPAGGLLPPVVVVEGVLTPSLDEQAELETALGITQPLAAAAHEGLTKAVTLAEQTMRSPLGRFPATAHDLVEQLDAAWSEATARPRGDLRQKCAQLLSRDRRYAMREILDGAFIRAEIRQEGRAAAVVYLPAEIRRRLPLFRSFPTRVIVEVVPRQDELESEPVALRARAVARTFTDADGRGLDT